MISNRHVPSTKRTGRIGEGSNTDYQAFLESKIKLATFNGIDVDASEVNPELRPHCKPIVLWALKGGQRAIFASFGLHKTTMQIEIMRLIGKHRGGHRLIVLPLGVRQEFFRDAAERFKGRYAVRLKFIRSVEEIEHDAGDGNAPIYVTNYETVRDGRLDVTLFTAASLDEASVLRSYGTKTYHEFLRLFDKVRFRFVATATPSPNRYKELIHYAGFLGIMDTGLALTRFFQRDSTSAGNLTLYPHKTEEFWLWVHSWAIFIQKPSDLCPCTCHRDRNLSAEASAASRSKDGTRAANETARGSADANAAANTSPLQTILSQAECSVAGVCDPSTGEKERAPTSSGRACSGGAAAKPTRAGPSTEGEESSCASDGASSQTSSLTWESRPQAAPSNDATTTATTSQETATGQGAKLRQETRGDQSSSPSKVERSHSRLGPKNSVSTIGSSTVATSWGGRPSACSRTWCDSCRCDEGYALPPLKVFYHEVPTDHGSAGAEKDGQGRLFRDAALGVTQAASEKRDSLTSRIETMKAITLQDPAAHWLLWHDLEDERRAIEKAVPGVVSVYGSQDLDTREANVIAFSDGKVQYLATKPELSGSGCNFQRHCHKAVFLGIGFKFNDFIQAIHRIYRFLQTEECEVHLIYTEAERGVLRTLKAKWTRHEEMMARMGEIIRKYGLDHVEMANVLKRSIGIERVEITSERYAIACNDCVDEARRQPDNAVDLIITSVPFSNHYEYTASYNDFGHTDDNSHFWQQMDFLTPELFRILKPGRLACIHVKDRILFGAVTGTGVPTVSPFHAETIFHARRHGFDFMGLITVVTDVVRENNQTYRLGWSENCKDGTKMGVGSPEYIVLLRKPQTDRSKSYADLPVIKDKADYTRARWQVDAHAYWRSSGNRQLRAEELAALGPDQLAKAFTEYSLTNLYDYEFHVKIGEELEAKGALPATFMSLAPGSHHPDVWHDVNRMLTLNSDQARRNVEMHICPLQFDIVDRLIERYSNPDELVYDPFGGLMTVPYRAILKGRRGQASELSHQSFLDGAYYCQAAERERLMPSLLDVIDAEVAA